MTKGVAAIGLLAMLTMAGACTDEDPPEGQDAAGVDDVPSDTADGSASDEPSGDTLTSFVDTFEDDRNGWAFEPSEFGTADIQDGDFVWDNAKPQLSPHMLPDTLGIAFDEGRLEMADVTVNASATPLRGMAAMGVFCRENPDTDADFQWYEFVVRDGYAAIRLADDAQNLRILAEVDDVELPLNETASIEATCADADDGSAQLTFVLNGETVLEAEHPDPLVSGAPGLQGYDAPADEADEPMMVAWHDFEVQPAS